MTFANIPQRTTQTRWPEKMPFQVLGRLKALLSNTVKIRLF
jgi:hypothetical protein